MFGKKKAKQKQEIVLINSAFGELRYGWGSWKLCTKPKITLWDTTYEVDCYVIAEAEEDGVSKKQEEAWEKFNNEIVEQQKQIEGMLLRHSGRNDEVRVYHKYIPSHIFFSRNGECALFVEDTDEEGYKDDPDAGFAIFLLPKLMLDSAEHCGDYIYGHTSFFTTKELYGDEGNS
jgi:hypothetical protein